ncbi:MAG: hypothetical protein U1E69_08490 [Tabrizicola sp.]|uniref:hypothetical protein n=1 Tax=Tabrizicola sp. TaxID=2005166 RepID=UPI002ABCB6E6|nr:hypothetical protein [Tabrizicola sp.]MDZ4086827.1 hypothetical protein [Tabrizicola sp.]
MTLATTNPPSAFGRFARATPVLGRVIRDIERDTSSIYYLLVIVLTAVVLAIQTWGLAALVLTALALVPVMFILLILIARP